MQAFVASASIASVFATFFTATPKAEAAWDCNAIGSSCVSVSNRGQYVYYVQGGVELYAKSSTYGHMEVWGADFHVNTSDKTFNNPLNKGIVAWDHKIYLNRNLPDGSQVCSQFWRKNGTSYTSGRVQCLTIER
jgi:hypothetical protein